MSVEISLLPQCGYRAVSLRRVGQEYADWAYVWLKTAMAKRTIKQRGRFSECAFAEAKTLYGLRRAKCRGLEKVAIQGLMTATVQNIKRIINSQRSKDRNLTASSFTKYSKSIIQLLKHLFILPQFSYSTWVSATASRRW